VQADLPDTVGALVAGGVSQRVAILLARRGIETPAEADEFLSPSLDQLHDPHGLPGLTRAVDRLLAGREQREKVAVVGDYDVDGVSATALLVAAMRACGLEARGILPERLKEGYGIQPMHVDMASEQGCKLVVTADCGSTALDAMGRAEELGIDVIVTDHHLGDSVMLPEQVIEVNPHRADSTYPFPHLSGVGVAFKLATALLAKADRTFDERALLRVACLGTICDLVPLVGENRVIAAAGLAALAETRSAGLIALMERASVKPPVTAVDVGFRIGPRINAAGRLGSPQPALDLLLSTDRAEAVRLAENLDGWNRQRQSTEIRVFEQAEEEFAALPELPPILVGWNEDWHPGVLGIAAGRIARIFHRPTILLHPKGEQAKGSGRSVPRIHLFDFLSGWREEYERFGGHAQAVGLTVSRESLEDLRQRWQAAAAAKWPPDLLVKNYRYELEVAPKEVVQSLLEELGQLEPFGMDNRQPVLRVGPLSLSGQPRRFGRNHLAVQATGADGGRVELLGWGWQEREEDLQGTFEVLATVDRDRYHGGPVLRLIDARALADGPAPD